jgi:DNA repair protein RadD
LDDESSSQSRKLTARAVPSAPVLRPYQTRAISDLRTLVRGGHKRVAVVLPTGGGKTVLALAIVLGHIAAGGRVLFLAHRDELIRQSAATFIEGGVPSVRIIQADRSAGDPDASVTVASIPTLGGKRWVDQLPQATLVIFDEAHHTRAKSWERIAAAYSESILIGLTATPERADGKPLGDIFGDIVTVSTVRELTDLGYLVPCSVFAPPEFRSTLADDPADAYIEHGQGRRGIIFCASVDHARATADRLTEIGVPAACVDGKIPAGTRRAHLARFAAGELRVVTNCNVLTEGFNDPGAEVCILARACDHVGLYLQIIGRVLRPAPGKESALLIDLRGVVHRHGLPDDERVYALEGDAIRTVDALPPLKQCKQCGYCGRTWRECPGCGFQQANPEPPEVRRERLAQIFATHDNEKRAAYWESLQSIARARGYHPNWCAHRFRARYGAPPARVA